MVRKEVPTSSLAQHMRATNDFNSTKVIANIETIDLKVVDMTVLKCRQNENESSMWEEIQKK